MGIRTKGKGVIVMKRLAIIFTVFVFMAGSLIYVPPVYAEETEDTITIEKDTSWFNYKNPKNSYKIKTEAELIGFASLVNETQYGIDKPNRLEHFENVTFVLATDIELTQEWQPVGSGTSSYFAGIFDGNGHTIKSMYVDSNGGSAGFFGYLTGEVKNLRVEGSIKNTGGSTGGIAGEISETGVISNCVTDIKIKGSSMTGGIVGFNNCGKVQNCTNYGNVEGTFKVGGVAGENWGGTLYQCGNRGDIKSTVRGVATYGTGGVAGRSVSSKSVVDECYNIGNIISNTEATGGVVGYCNAVGAEISNSYNNGSITITEDKKAAIKTYVGGVAGIIGSKGIEMHNCYSVKKIDGGDVQGGVIGKYINDPNDDTNKNAIDKNYYVEKNFDEGIGQYIEKASYLDDAARDTSAGSLGRSASTLGSSFKNDSSGKFGNYGYPVLKWQEPPEDGHQVFLKYIPESIQIHIDKNENEDKTKEPGRKYKMFIRPDSSIDNSVSVYLKEEAEKETK